MALFRTFSVGRFRCSGASLVVSRADFPSEGYALVVRKDSTKRFCLGCIKDFVASKRALDAIESEKYLTIISS
jgi:hypothetical protein